MKCIKLDDIGARGTSSVEESETFINGALTKRKIQMPDKIICPECENSDNLIWTCSQESTSGVAEGRLRTHEVHTVFYLGCHYCSETIKRVSGDEVAEFLTNNIDLKL